MAEIVYPHYLQTETRQVRCYGFARLGNHMSHDEIDKYLDLDTNNGSSVCDRFMREDWAKNEHEISK
jgi:hypothetical protein